ncbi:MAG TPA: metallophosphoesterase [Dokdonella sp.]
MKTVLRQSRHWLAALGAAALIAGCAAPAGAPETQRSIPASTTLLVFGDTGYHYDYLAQKDYRKVVTEAQFLAKEREDWIEDKRPIGELAYPPMYRLPANGSVIAASGQMPVALAMQAYCAAHGCDHGAMLGDNIYPDGATAGADGIDDAKRFHDLFTVPYGPLVSNGPDFRIYSVLGNHDWHTSREGAMAQVNFLARTPPFYMDGLFYRAVLPGTGGQVEIFAIDTEVMLAATTVYEAELTDDAQEATSTELEKFEPWAVPQTDAERNMVAWLESSLASSQARWKIVIGHHPLWSTAGSKFEQARALRRLILPSLCRHADLYLAGHEHTLEVHTDDCSAAGAGTRRAPLPQIVSGAAAKMRPINSTFLRHQVEKYPELDTLWARGMVWGFAHLTLEGDRAVARIVEVPSDGSPAHIAYEHSFARRGAD